MEFASAEEKAATGKLVQTVDTTVEARNRYSLTNEDVAELARYAVIIENTTAARWTSSGAKTAQTASSTSCKLARKP